VKPFVTQETNLHLSPSVVPKRRGWLWPPALLPARRGLQPGGRSLHPGFRLRFQPGGPTGRPPARSLRLGERVEPTARPPAQRAIRPGGREGCEACDPSTMLRASRGYARMVHPAYPEQRRRERCTAKGRPSVTQQAESYPPMQWMVGERCRLEAALPEPAVVRHEDGRRVVRAGNDTPGSLKAGWRKRSPVRDGAPVSPTLVMIRQVGHTHRLSPVHGSAGR
jgi:hypothetical protein